MQVFFPSTGTESTFPVNFIEYTPDQPLTWWQDLKIFVFPAIHKVGLLPHSLHIECSEGILAYSGDTEGNGNIPALCRDSNLFICEAYTFDRRKKTTWDDGKKIMLTHAGEEVLQKGHCFLLRRHLTAKFY